jgi:hypothetical protein
MSETRRVPIRHAYSSIIEPGWAEMVRKFRPMVRATSQCIEVNVICGLALRITRLAIASDLLGRKGLDEEGHIPQRSASEAYVNLGYIFHSGPRRKPKTGSQPEKDTRGLCLQFCAYADIAYLKLVSKDPDRVRETFKKRQGLSDSEYDALHAEHLRLADEAINIHGCTKERWHTMNIQDMAQKLLDDPPPFMDHEFCKLLLSNFVSSNSAVHADALSIRTQYKDHGSDLLELVLKPDVVRGDAVASLAVSSWKAIGWYLNESTWVDKMVNDQLRNVLRERFDAAADNPTSIVIPNWLSEGVTRAF